MELKWHLKGILGVCNRLPDLSPSYTAYKPDFDGYRPPQVAEQYLHGSPATLDHALSRRSTAWSIGMGRYALLVGTRSGRY